MYLVPIFTMLSPVKTHLSIYCLKKLPRLIQKIYFRLLALFYSHHSKVRVTFHMKPKGLEVFSYTCRFVELQAVSWVSSLVYVLNHYKLCFSDQTWNIR